MALVELPRRAAPNFMESGRLAAAIDERISRNGAVLRPLDADEVRRGIALRCSPIARAWSFRRPR